MTSSQPRTSTRRKNPLIGKTIKSIQRTSEDNMAHLCIDFTDGSSASFTAHAPQPDWDDAAYWADNKADAVDVKLSRRMTR